MVHCSMLPVFAFRRNCFSISFWLLDYRVFLLQAASAALAAFSCSSNPSALAGGRLVQNMCHRCFCEPHKIQNPKMKIASLSLFQYPRSKTVAQVYLQRCWNKINATAVENPRKFVDTITAVEIPPHILTCPVELLYYLELIAESK